MEKTYILTAGYPDIKARQGDEITSVHKLEIPNQEPHLLPIPDFSDYNIVMIKSIWDLLEQPEKLDCIGTYHGILTMPFHPLWRTYNYGDAGIEAQDVNGEWHKKPDTSKEKLEELSAKAKKLFIEHYSIKLAEYLESTKTNGQHLSLDDRTKLGKFFEKYNKKLSYIGTFEPSISQKLSEGFDELSTRLSNASKSKRASNFEPFATNVSGLVVGAIVKAGETLLVLYPKVFLYGEPEEKRFLRTFIAELESMRIEEHSEDRPKWLSKIKLNREKFDRTYKEFEAAKNEINYIEDLYWRDGEKLENAVLRAFRDLGFEVYDNTSKRNTIDHILKMKNQPDEFIIQIKGHQNGPITQEDVSEIIAANPRKKIIFVGNPFRLDDFELRERSRECYSTHALKVIHEGLEKGSLETFYPITSIDLAKWKDLGLTSEQVISEMKKKQP